MGTFKMMEMAGLWTACWRRVYQWHQLKGRVTWAENSQSIWRGCSSLLKLSPPHRCPLFQQKSKGFNVCNAGFQSCFGPIPPCSVPFPLCVKNGNVYFVMEHELCQVFFTMLTTMKSCPESQKRSWVLTSEQLWSCEDLGDSERG